MTHAAVNKNCEDKIIRWTPTTCNAAWHEPAAVGGCRCLVMARLNPSVEQTPQFLLKAQREAPLVLPFSNGYGCYRCSCHGFGCYGYGCHEYGCHAWD